jgi:hypothetical protein
MQFKITLNWFNMPPSTDPGTLFVWDAHSIDLRQEDGTFIRRLEPDELRLLDLRGGTWTTDYELNHNKNLTLEYDADWWKR